MIGNATKPIQIRLPKWAKDKVEINANKKGLSISATIREMICEQLN